METAVKLRTRPLKPGFGAEILDVDLNAADEAEPAPARPDDGRAPEREAA